MSQRTVLGFLAAPLVAAVGVLLSSIAARDAFSDPLEFLVSIVLWWLYGMLFTAVLALPLFLLLRSLNLLRWWTSLATGLIVGGVGIATLNGRTLFDVVQLVVCGGLGGLAFWLIAKSDLRPNNALERP
jgi:hypothetical protein